MRLRYRLWALICAAFCLGIFAGLLLPPMFLAVIEGILLVFIAICKICS
ncbi:MAG: hypothetical protein IKU87_01480 [Clostridia bacterium]|nr:hypothetical protein [Clostridia bacterium]